MHPRRLYAKKTIVDPAGRELSPKEHAAFIAELEVRNIKLATEILNRRIREHNLAVEMRKRLAALRKTAKEYLEAQGRAGDEVRTVAVIRGESVTETIPGPLARVAESLDAVEREVLSWGAHDFSGKRVEMEWRERWTLDVETWLSSREMAEVLRTVTGEGERVRGHLQQKKLRDETKAAGKNRKRVLAKMGWTEARAEFEAKHGASKR